MLKVFPNSKVATINRELIKYIKGYKKMPENAKFMYIWAKDKSNPSTRYAGQILYHKVLPNGNRQTRLVTAYGTDDIGMTTIVKSPSGELLKAYSGVRGPHRQALLPDGKLVRDMPGTQCYISGTREEVSKQIPKMFCGNIPADGNNSLLLLM